MYEYMNSFIISSPGYVVTAAQRNVADCGQNNYKLESKLRRRATHSAATILIIQVHFHIRTITYIS
jgi:hypothetical protein